MKLRVVINTHKRPAQALAVVECLRAMASGKYEAYYVVAFDDEDTVSQAFRHVFSEVTDVETVSKPRPASLQDVWNLNLTDPSLADFGLPMPDDGFCAAPDWDDLIVLTAAQAPVPELAVLGWLDQANVDMFTVPIVSRGWLEAIAPTPLLDPGYAYWFADTAISDLVVCLRDGSTATQLLCCWPASPESQTPSC